MPEVKKTQEPPQEKCWRVIFNAKSSPNDTEDVILSVNGESLVCRREVETIIPDRYKECADHATYVTFRQLPDKPRKIMGRIKKYPYQVVTEATWAEYEKMKAEGTKSTKEAIQKHGYDYDPDME